MSCIELKQISLITISKKQNNLEEPLIGFIRIDLSSLYSKEDADNINSLLKKYPQKDFKYSFFSLQNNCYYTENNLSEFEKITTTKKEKIKKRKIELYAQIDNGFKVFVKLKSVA